jgi:hypothetical protein
VELLKEDGGCGNGSLVVGSELKEAVGNWRTGSTVACDVDAVLWVSWGVTSSGVGEVVGSWLGGDAVRVLGRCLRVGMR